MRITPKSVADGLNAPFAGELTLAVIRERVDEVIRIDDATILAGVTIECDDFSWEPEITVKVLHKGAEIIEVPIAYHPRKNSEGKKINWTHGVKALWTVYRYHIQ